MESDLWNSLKKEYLNAINQYDGRISEEINILYLQDMYNCIFTDKKSIPNSSLRSYWIAFNKLTSAIWKNANSNLTNYAEIEKSYKSLRGLFWNECNSAVLSLNQNGFYEFSNPLPRDLYIETIDTLSKAKLNPSNSSQQIVSEIALSRENILLNQNEFIRWHYPPNVVANLSLVRSLLNDGSLLTILLRYLKSIPKPLRPSCWLSKGIKDPSNALVSAAAQQYHFDYDSFNFLKLMIYLSDVDDSNGPHHFVAGSHKPFSSGLLSCIKSPYFRISDNDLFRFYQSTQEKIFKGIEAKAFLVDTSGFHKGGLLDKDFYREILQIEFVDSPIVFGHDTNWRRNSR